MLIILLPYMRCGIFLNQGNKKLQRRYIDALVIWAQASNISLNQKLFAMQIVGSRQRTVLDPKTGHLISVIDTDLANIASSQSIIPDEIIAIIPIRFVIIFKVEW